MEMLANRLTLTVSVVFSVSCPFLFGGGHETFNREVQESVEKALVYVYGKRYSPSRNSDR